MNVEEKYSGQAVRTLAVFFILLGVEAAGKIFKRLSPKTTELVAAEIARLGSVNEAEKKVAIEEFYPRIWEEPVDRRGGVSFVKEALQGSFGKIRSDAILARITREGDMPFRWLAAVEPQQIHQLICDEKPQTIALVMSFLDVEKASEVLTLLSAEVQAEVVMAISGLVWISPEFVKDIEEELEKKLTGCGISMIYAKGGPEKAAQILNHLNREAEKQILDKMTQASSDIAERVKKLLFVFEDLILMDDKCLQTVLREVDSHVLVLALKSAPSPLVEKIFRNLSPKANEMIAEEIKGLGPVRKKDIDEARGQIADSVNRLEKEGHIIVKGRGGGADEVIL